MTNEEKMLQENNELKKTIEDLNKSLQRQNEIIKQLQQKLFGEKLRNWLLMKIRLLCLMARN